MEENTTQHTDAATAPGDLPMPEPVPRAAPIKVADSSQKGGWLAQLPYLALFAAVLLLLSLTSVRRKSATFDEGSHLPAGFSYLAYRDFRMNMEHPPLIKLLAGLPLRALSAKADSSHASWKTGDQFYFGEEFLYSWNDADRLLFWGRVPIVLLSVLFGVVVFFCAREWYGAKAGYVALLLYLFTPDLLAHGQLVTTDLGVAGFMFLAVYAFFRALRLLTPIRFLLAALATSCAIVTKFSGVLIFPMLAAIGILFAISATPIAVRFGKVSRTFNTWAGKLGVVASMLAGSAILSFLLIWSCYGWRHTMTPDPKMSQGIKWDQIGSAESFVADTVRWTREQHLLPEAFVYGFLKTQESTTSRSAFLMGEYSTEGWWYYFLITFAVKTPIPLLLLIVLAAVFIKRYGAGWLAEAALLVPVAIYTVFALSSSLNIGHRHLLPIYPFLIVFTAKMARALEFKRQRALAVVCALLLVWNVVETGKTYPNFLTYFNQFAGGPANGYQWLVDSNLDWGQDLKELAQYRREHPDEPFFLSYFGSAKPEYYGIKARFLPSFNTGNQRRTVEPVSVVQSGAIVAVSATSLQCANIRNYEAPGIEQFMERLRNRQPIAVIGHSILIYRMP